MKLRMSPPGLVPTNTRRTWELITLRKCSAKNPTLYKHVTNVLKQCIILATQSSKTCYSTILCISYKYLRTNAPVYMSSISQILKIANIRFLDVIIDISQRNCPKYPAPRQKCHLLCVGYKVNMQNKILIMYPQCIMFVHQCRIDRFLHGVSSKSPQQQESRCCLGAIM